MDFLADPIFTEFGRSDFIGGIDNEALDFGHLEQFIHVTASTGDGEEPTRLSTVNLHDGEVVPTTTNNINNSGLIQSHLPESPPDSGSEPPFSPVDLQGLTLTSRATSTNDALSSRAPSIYSNLFPRELKEIENKLKDDSVALVDGGDHQQQQNHHSIHDHRLYLEHNNQPSLLLAATHQLHHQSMQHAEVEDNRHECANENPDTLLAMQSHTNKNIHLNSIEDISDVGSQRSAYNRQVMMMTPQQLLTSSIIPSDAYMGTPAPMIETPTAVSQNNRKRKLLQVDCTSMLTIKPEPGASLSPLCQQNPGSPVGIKLQKIGCTGTEIGSPSLSSLSPAATSLSLSNDNNSLDGIGAGTPNGASFVGSNATDSSSESTPMQCIRFSPFQQHSWHTLCDQSLQEITIAHYRVDADKGFNFSVSDDAFVCQKKNHFQITCHARLQGDAEFVKTPSGLEKIKSFYLHFYGVKLEAPNQTIRVEQSQSDRSKKPFYPVPIDLQSHLVSKVTVGRLHFSETTNNNMRKKGRPNPEQRYFQLVVGLHVHTLSGHFPIVSQGSERIIVRASNPGQFESDVELCWQRGITPESIFHAGRVGINTDRPDESLVIHGNLKVSGHIIQPSDSRAKQEISELDTAVQLRNLQKIRIVRYRYEPEFAMHSGLKSAEDNEEIVDTGVIAQEVREVLPDAVQEAGSIVLPSGQVIDNFLLVNKDRILMENIGAVKELCKVTGSLETRIEQLEKINNRLMKMQEFDRNKKKFKLPTDDNLVAGEDEICSNRTIQMMIIILVIIMATCLVAVSTLYFVEHSKQRYMKRYDRYDISHHLVSHDAILINSNNNNINPRNTNYNGYHTNKSGKILLHSHMPLPPTTRQPINSQQSSNFDTALLPQPVNIPISVIQASYPSTRAGSGVISHGSNTDSEASKGVKGALENEKTNDELPIRKDKSPVPSISTVSSSHINNKTGSSKNKAKWPLPETVTISSAITSAYNINEEPIEESLNISETSSEKVADSIPLPQDFENNSIDGSDASQKTESHINQNGVLPIDHGIVGSTTRNKAHELGNSVRSVAETNIEVGAVKIESTVDISPTSSASSLFVVYKNVQSKNINDTVSQSVNFTMETPSITNKSRGIDTEDADLQYLGNSNDSDDQSLADITTIPVVVKTFSLAPIGLPDHCVKIKREEISNCQSACFEDTNNLPSQNTEGELRRRHIEIPASNNTTLVVSTGGSVAALSSNLKSYPKPQTEKSAESTSSMERSQLEEAKGNQGNESLEQEHIETDTNQPHKDSTRKIDLIEKQSVNEPRTSSDCASITPWLQADTFNVSLGCEEICHNGGSSLNISYEIPLSKYLKETNVELYFVAPANLHWAVCSNKEKTKREGSSVTNALSNGKVFQKNQNVSIFYLIIPGHGYFERLIELRAAMDSTKNLCREEADETKVFLQYNIRILRDCD